MGHLERKMGRFALRAPATQPVRSQCPGCPRSQHGFWSHLRSQPAWHDLPAPAPGTPGGESSLSGILPIHHGHSQCYTLTSNFSFLHRIKTNSIALLTLHRCSRFYLKKNAMDDAVFVKIKSHPPCFCSLFMSRCCAL